jgi:hypothetical protein
MLSGLCGNPMPESTIPPSQGLRIWLQIWGYGGRDGCGSGMGGGGVEEREEGVEKEEGRGTTELDKEEDRNGRNNLAYTDMQTLLPGRVCSTLKQPVLFRTYPTTPYSASGPAFAAPRQMYVLYSRLPLEVSFLQHPEYSTPGPVSSIPDCTLQTTRAIVPHLDVSV